MFWSLRERERMLSGWRLERAECALNTRISLVWSTQAVWAGSGRTGAWSSGKRWPRWLLPEPCTLEKQGWWRNLATLLSSGNSLLQRNTSSCRTYIRFLIASLSTCGKVTHSPSVQGSGQIHLLQETLPVIPRLEIIPETFGCTNQYTSQVAPVVKNPPANAGRRKRHRFDP